ncbi:FtsH protease activity modulator HflK [Notoacmeibacter sp. MSK16QG-6]|uniref:FtsH protease activity modulator HflK n=1 Tax=Notoacmeibacter sp. MSK16QG-6 TaxID=2957982 RepID=UPI00209D13AA|nr:FtsH protease activity modulator HflK [Notoacmeibacter sp. MSK16QG-6]MCP1199654.1 FtsH protease activity modulator HflK [Notoacmeibacter sp. MSK16QG-6]
MPWSNQGGGGSGGPWGGDDKGGGRNNGPWGNGPQRPRGPQNSTPDLEDIIRRGQDRIRRIGSGGPKNGNGGNGGLGAGMIAGLVALGVVGVVLFQSFYTVQPDEIGVELLFGKPKQEFSEPGLHYHFWPLETVDKVTTAEKLVTIGSSNSSRDTSGLMLSGDQNIVDVVFSIAYQVADPANYLFAVADPDDMLRQVGESAMREVVGRRPAQDIFRDNRAEIAEQVRATIQQTLDEYSAGLSVNAISIEDAAPPSQVADAFDEVQRAEQDEDRFVEEGNRYSNQILGQARGEAAQILEGAAGYKNRVVQEAKGEAQRFSSIYEEYAKAPEITRKRLFLETMENVFRNSNKVIVEQGASGTSGVVPYLPLDQLQRSNNRSQRDNSGSNSRSSDANTQSATSGGNQ